MKVIILAFAWTEVKHEKSTRGQLGFRLRSKAHVPNKYETEALTLKASCCAIHRNGNIKAKRVKLSAITDRGGL
jgi:hypothetical protein